MTYDDAMAARHAEKVTATAHSAAPLNRKAARERFEALAHSRYTFNRWAASDGLAALAEIDALEIELARVRSLVENVAELARAAGCHSETDGRDDAEVEAALNALLADAARDGRAT